MHNPKDANVIRLYSEASSYMRLPLKQGNGSKRNYYSRIKDLVRLPNGRRKIHALETKYQSFHARRKYVTLPRVQKRKNNASDQTASNRHAALCTVYDRMRSKLEPNEIKYHDNQSFPCLRGLSDLHYQCSAVSQVTSYFYQAFCKKRLGHLNSELALHSKYINQGVMSSIVLPAFFNRKLAICPSLPQEAEYILRNLYISNLDNPIPREIHKLLLNQGYLMLPGALHRLVVLVSCVTRKLLGAIHFSIRSNPLHCRVKSVVVDPSVHGKRYGTLLLAYAIQTAKENGCSSVSLQSSEEAIDFYFKFGFIANSSSVDSYSNWECLSPEEKEDLVLSNDNELILEFNDDGIDARLEELMDGAIST